MASIGQILERMLDTLRRDERVAALVKDRDGEFRLGSLPGLADTVAALPLVYVTMPGSMQQSRRVLGGAPGPASPPEIVTYTVHAVGVVYSGEGPFQAQLDVYELAEAIVGALSRNLTLVDAEGRDPLSHDITMRMQDRFGETMGTDKEAVTVTCHVTTWVDHSINP